MGALNDKRGLHLPAARCLPRLERKFKAGASSGARLEALQGSREGAVDEGQYVGGVGRTPCLLKVTVLHIARRGSSLAGMHACHKTQDTGHKNDADVPDSSLPYLLLAQALPSTHQLQLKLLTHQPAQDLCLALLPD